MDRRLALRSLIAAGILFATSPSFAKDPACAGFENQVTGLQHEILPPTSTDLNTTLLRVSADPPILNQGRRGFCWLYAMFSNLLQRLAQRTGQAPKLSIYYNSYFHWLDDAIAAALNIKSTGVDEGGNAPDAVSNFLQNGVISEEEWAGIGGSSTIQIPSKNAVELPQVNALVQRSHASLSALESWLKPETVTSHFFARKQTRVALDNLIAEKTAALRAGKFTHFTSALVEKMKAAVAAKASGASLVPADAQAILQAEQDDIRFDVTRLFNQIYFKSDASPLDKIDLVSAQKKAAELFPEIATRQFYLQLSMDRDQKPEIYQKWGAGVTVLVSIDDASRILGLLMKADTPTVIVYDHQTSFVDERDPKNPQNTGTMSVRRIRDVPVSAYVSRLERKMPSVHYTRDGHLVDAVGVYVMNNPTPEQRATGHDITAFRIHNSWGEQNGISGEFIMDLSYFGAFVDGLSGFVTDLDRPEIATILGDKLMAKLLAY